MLKWSSATFLLVMAAACGSTDGGGERPRPGAASPPAGRISLTGAGATFPSPLYSRWFADYGAVHQLQVNYQAIGSGGGIQQVIAGTVDFGASDAPLNAEEAARVPGMLQLPTVAGAVAVTYHVSGLRQPLRLSGPLLADIFLGRVSRWNDPAIAADNPGVTLPATSIAVVHRSDGSGTTAVFTDYLAEASEAWNRSVGRGKSVSWPGGLGAKGNEGIAGAVRQTEGAIGYVELAYAKQNQLAMAALRNASGEWVTPSVDAIAAAAAAAAGRAAGGDFRTSLVNPAGAQSYPISTWTYLLVPAHWEDCAKAQAFSGLLSWALTRGSATARELDYAPLPAAVREAVVGRLGSLTCGASHQAVTPAA